MKNLREQSVFALVAGCLFALGCNGAYNADTGYDARLKAAQNIQDSSERTEALRTLVLDAANESREEIVKSALESMDNTAIKDEVAEKAALTLADLGNGNAATEVAEMISEQESRDATLGAIAESDQTESGGDQ